MTEPKHVLVVDDQDYVREVLCRWIEADGHYCEAAGAAPEALEQLGSRAFDLVLSDISMPGMSGLDLLREIRRRYPDVAVLMETAIDDRETAIDALQRGAYGYLIKPLQEQEVVIAVANALQRKRLELLERDYREHLEQTVLHRTEEIREAREEISLLLVTISEFRDLDTGLHVRRMGLYAEALARALGWDLQMVDQIRLAAPMHDVGKIAVPDSVLLKPGRLTEEEFEQIKKHAEVGAEILSRTDLPLLRLAREIARGHHERWDGSGYPEGRRGKQIPAPARLVALVDVYDALTNDRVYRPALTEADAIDIMREGRGSHFDPEMFDRFIEVLPELRCIRVETDGHRSTGGSIDARCDR